MLRSADHSILTTGDVARICQVAPRTVGKWFDSGRLKGYRVPGSQDRRIPRDNLIEFMRAHRMPLGELADDAERHALVIGLPQTEWEALQAELAAVGVSAKRAASLFEAGIVVAESEPECVVIDSRFGAGDAARVLRAVKGLKAGPVRTIALVGDEDGNDFWMSGGFDDRFRRPFDLALLAVRTRSLTETARPR